MDVVILQNTLSRLNLRKQINSENNINLHRLFHKTLFMHKMNLPKDFYRHQLKEILDQIINLNGVSKNFHCRLYKLHYFSKLNLKVELNLQNSDTDYFDFLHDRCQQLPKRYLHIKKKLYTHHEIDYDPYFINLTTFSISFVLPPYSSVEKNCPNLMWTSTSYEQNFPHWFCFFWISLKIDFQQKMNKIMINNSFLLIFTVDSSSGILIDISMSAVLYKIISQGDASDCWQYLRPPKSN